MKQLKHTATLLLIGLCISLITSPAYGKDESQSVISGTIKDKNGIAIQAATIFVKELQKGTLSDENGQFTIIAKPGVYTVTVQFIGYEPYEKKIDTKNNKTVSLKVQLKDTSYNLNEVVVESKSPVQRVKETALNVVAIDTKALYNTNLDIANTLGKVSGVKIREVGGVGSDAQISLNGFTGKYIKIFMDGVPMEGSGSSFQINNIPVNLADRIEVYKGVVPVEFGGDAIGGAINIVTKQTSNTYVDASYSYGSFNTHRSNLSVGYTAKNGFTASVNAYQNYSDNSYKIKSYLLDFDTENWENTKRWFKRFHDRYHNEAIIAKVGFTNKPWADKLLFGVNLSQESAQIQNANIMQIVFGGKKRTAKTITPSFTYSKRNLFVKNLNLTVNAKYNKNRSENIDTLARQYNWAGDYKEKGSKGESKYSLARYDNENYHATANLRYSFFNQHFFSLNNTFSDFSRKSRDKAAGQDTSAADFMRRVNRKNILGFSYKYMPISAWNILGFVKHYNTTVKGPVNISTTTTDQFVEKTKRSSITGYGGATTYHISPSLQVKASYEIAYRLPNERELFGDEVLESGNTSLKPEKSKNLNFNISYDTTFNDLHNISIDLGVSHRITTDYIRRIIEQRYGGASSINHGKISNLGFDLEARYTYKNALSFGGNFTYQNLKNEEKFDHNGKKLVYYKDRVPNVPYMFGSFDASYTLKNTFIKTDLLSFGYNLRYVHEFYRDWKSEGGDITIPSQFSHDLSLTYSLKNGTYNIALEANNITDEILYDNYSLQKPGRNFSVKFRYFFFKAK